MKTMLLSGAIAMIVGVAHAQLIQPSMDGANWDIRYSPHMPLHPTNLPPQFGGWSFNFTPAPMGVCPAADTQPPNFDQSPCPHVDYVTTNYVHNLSTAVSVTMTLEVSVTQGTTFDFHTQFENTCGGVATVRFLLEHTGDSSLNHVNYRYWSNPTSFTLASTGLQAYTMTVNIDPSLWSNVDGQFGTANLSAWGALLRNIGKVGMTFGGGCFFGHGVYVNPPTGAAQFQVRSFTFN